MACSGSPGVAAVLVVAFVAIGQDPVVALFVRLQLPRLWVVVLVNVRGLAQAVVSEGIGTQTAGDLREVGNRTAVWISCSAVVSS